MSVFDYDSIIRNLQTGRYYGNFKTLLKGSGLERGDIRHYVDGDDAKLINWKASAKHNELYVSTVYADKDGLLEVFFDVTINWKSGLDQSYESLISTYYLDLVVYCLRHGIHLSCFVVDDITKKLVCYDIGRDKTKAYNFLTVLQGIIRRQKAPYTSFLESFLGHIVAHKKRRGLLLFSDFLGLDSRLVEHIVSLQSLYPFYLFRLDIDRSSGKNFEKRYISWHDYKLPLIDI